MLWTHTGPEVGCALDTHWSRGRMWFGHTFVQRSDVLWTQIGPEVACALKMLTVQKQTCSTFEGTGALGKEDSLGTTRSFSGSSRAKVHCIQLCSHGKISTGTQCRARLSRCSSSRLPARSSCANFSCDSSPVSYCAGFALAPLKRHVSTSLAFETLSISRMFASRLF